LLILKTIKIFKKYYQSIVVMWQRMFSMSVMRTAWRRESNSPSPRSTFEKSGLVSEDSKGTFPHNVQNSSGLHPASSQINIKIISFEVSGRSLKLTLTENITKC